MSKYNLKNPLGIIKNRNDSNLIIKIFDYDIQQPKIITDDDGVEKIIPQEIIIYSYLSKMYKGVLRLADLSKTLPNQEKQNWGDRYILTKDNHAFFIDDMIEYLNN